MEEGRDRKLRCRCSLPDRLSVRKSTEWTITIFQISSHPHPHPHPHVRDPSVTAGGDRSILSRPVVEWVSQ